MDFKAPSVEHIARDSERDVTYAVMAYRQLTRVEVVQCVRMYSAQRRAKPKKCSRITIITTIGFNES